MTDKKSKFSQLDRNLFFGLVALWVLCAIIINTFNVAKFIPMATQEGYIGEKVEITHIQRRNEWLLLPDKAKNVTPRFICYYFKDNFCDKVGNYQYASDVHYLKIDGGPDYVKNKIGGDFNAIMQNATIYTKDNQVIHYEISSDELEQELNFVKSQKLGGWLIYLIPIFMLLCFIIPKILKSKKQPTNLT